MINLKRISLDMNTIVPWFLTTRSDHVLLRPFFLQSLRASAGDISSWLVLRDRQLRNLSLLTLTTTLRRRRGRRFTFVLILFRRLLRVRVITRVQTLHLNSQILSNLFINQLFIYCTFINLPNFARSTPFLFKSSVGYLFSASLFQPVLMVL